MVESLVYCFKLLCYIEPSYCMMSRQVEAEEIAQQKCSPKELPLHTEPGCHDSVSLGVQVAHLLAQALWVYPAGLCSIPSHSHPFSMNVVTLCAFFQCVLISVLLLINQLCNLESCCFRPTETESRILKAHLPRLYWLLTTAVFPALHCYRVSTFTVPLLSDLTFHLADITVFQSVIQLLLWNSTRILYFAPIQAISLFDLLWLLFLKMSSKILLKASWP